MTEDRDDTESPSEETEPPGDPRGFLWELIGCMIPLAALAAFLFLVMWGYQSLFGPSRPVPVESGEIQFIVLQTGDGKEYAGRRCRVYAEWVAIEADGATVMIPRDRVQSLRLAPSR